MTTVAGAGARRRPFVLELPAVACTVVLLAVAFCVVYPLLLVVLESFQVAPPGQPAKCGLDGWRAAFAEPLLRAALINTLKVTVTRQALSLALAILVAWLIARTDLPGRNWIEFAFWAAFFLPTLTVTLSWILLLDPDYGLINLALVGLGLVGRGPFDIYSFWGIVWIHVITGSLTVKVILLTPAFRNMNAAFEEASRVAGASTARTALSITVPVMAPVVLSVLLLGTMVSLQTFEVEQVLGVPFRFFVFSTMVYDLIVTRVPRYDAATALSVVVLAAMLPLIVTQQWLTRGRRYTTITGQFQSRRQRLGRWRWPAFVLALLLTLVVLGVPLVFAVLGTFMKLFGFFNIPDPWTLKNWKTVLTDDLFLRSLVNTVVLATSTAVAAVLIHSLIAYIVVRTRYRARQALDVISWLPFTVPGIILGLALLWLFLDVGFLRPMYGTMAVLVIAGLVSGMPLGVQIVKSGLMQLGGDLEEASRVAGASWWATYRRIVLRLMAPTLVAVGMITFVGAARNIGNIALLATSANRPLSILQLDYIAQRKFEEAMVVACIIMAISLVGALVARVLGLRGGLG
ncbi:MAG: iron ABC transporter permease [Candidatus Rokuibacteriota bacterium]|nr:MAG: iron ABC transporter permease [Candidatus Rokubacteria bacterium]PYO12079.1 MAG: iron ABC transporter permease [Candidatus Rokubacteria bacterium]